MYQTSSPVFRSSATSPLLDQSAVGFLAVDCAAEQRLAAAAGDFARDILLPEDLTVVRIERPDEALLLRRNNNVAPVGRCGDHANTTTLHR